MAYAGITDSSERQAVTGKMHQRIVDTPPAERNGVQKFRLMLSVYCK